MRSRSSNRGVRICNINSSCKYKGFLYKKDNNITKEDFKELFNIVNNIVLVEDHYSKRNGKGYFTKQWFRLNNDSKVKITTTKEVNYESE